MRLALRTVTAEEAARILPPRVLIHAQLDYNAAAVVVTGDFGERFGYFQWGGAKEGVLLLDDPTLECGDACAGDHLLEEPCNFLEMAAAAQKLLER